MGWEDARFDCYRSQTGKSVFADVDATNAIDRIETQPGWAPPLAENYDADAGFDMGSENGPAPFRLSDASLDIQLGRTAKRWRSAFYRESP